MDPYEVLGLKYTATKEEIRARYHALARKHHPDKLQHLPKEERDRNEQEFKKINVAYELLTKQEFEHTSKKDWEGVWSSVHTFMSNPELVQNMGDLLRNVFQAAREYKKQKGSEHHIQVEVSLEELHQRKEKRLRLFLRNQEEPIFLTLDCGCYPSFMHTHITPEGKTLFVHLTMVLKTHPIYTLDTMFQTNDLYMTLELTLYEYLAGCTKEVPYLDGTFLQLKIEPCFQGQLDIPQKGLYGKGTLTVYPKTVLPTKIQMESIPENKRDRFYKYVKAISRPPHSGAKT